MCNCEREINEKFKERYPGATYIAGQYEMFSGRSYSTVTIHVPNKKKPIEQLLLNSYCPHCGEKYPDKEA